MHPTPSVDIAGRSVGPEHPPFVVAEAGVNHNGNADMAIALVDAAADAGADAVKFQTFRADALASVEAPLASYQRQLGQRSTQRAMLRPLELAPEVVRATQQRASDRGLIWFSTPFDAESVDFLATLDVPVFKIGSGDLTNLILLRAVAKRALPMIISTGMATLREVQAAVTDIRRHGNPPLIVLQCVSAYPSEPGDVNLRAMETLAKYLKTVVGFSDHTTGIGAPIAAAALGASLIEKHLTLDRALPGPDHAASLDPGSFATMVMGIREAYAALGDGRKVPKASEADVRFVARRSLVAAHDLEQGRVLSARDVGAVRPGSGLSPLRLDDLIGRELVRPLRAGDQFTPDSVSPSLE